MARVRETARKIRTRYEPKKGLATRPSRKSVAENHRRIGEDRQSKLASSGLKLIPYQEGAFSCIKKIIIDYDEKYILVVDEVQHIGNDHSSDQNDFKECAVDYAECHNNEGVVNMVTAYSIKTFNEGLPVFTQYCSVCRQTDQSLLYPCGRSESPSESSLALAVSGSPSCRLHFCLECYNECRSGDRQSAFIPDDLKLQTLRSCFQYVSMPNFSEIVVNGLPNKQLATPCLPITIIIHILAYAPNESQGPANNKAVLNALRNYNVVDNTIVEYTDGFGCDGVGYRLFYRNVANPTKLRQYLLQLMSTFDEYARNGVFNLVIIHDGHGKEGELFGYADSNQSVPFKVEKWLEAYETLLDRIPFINPTNDYRPIRSLVVASCHQKESNYINWFKEKEINCGLFPRGDVMGGNAFNFFLPLMESVLQSSVHNVPMLEQLIVKQPNEMIKMQWVHFDSSTNDITNLWECSEAQSFFSNHSIHSIPYQHIRCCLNDDQNMKDKKEELLRVRQQDIERFQNAIQRFQRKITSSVIPITFPTSMSTILNMPPILSPEERRAFSRAGVKRVPETFLTVSLRHSHSCKGHEARFNPDAKGPYYCDGCEENIQIDGILGSRWQCQICEKEFCHSCALRVSIMNCKFQAKHRTTSLATQNQSQPDVAQTEIESNLNVQSSAVIESVIVAPSPFKPFPCGYRNLTRCSSSMTVTVSNSESATTCSCSFEGCKESWHKSCASQVARTNIIPLMPLDIRYCRYHILAFRELSNDGQCLIDTVASSSYILSKMISVIPFERCDYGTMCCRPTSEEDRKLYSCGACQIDGGVASRKRYHARCISILSDQPHYVPVHTMAERACPQYHNKIATVLLHCKRMLTVHPNTLPTITPQNQSVNNIFTKPSNRKIPRIRNEMKSNLKATVPTAAATSKIRSPLSNSPIARDYRCYNPSESDSGNNNNSTTSSSTLTSCSNPIVAVHSKTMCDYHKKLQSHGKLPNDVKGSVTANCEWCKKASNNQLIELDDSEMMRDEHNVTITFHKETGKATVIDPASFNRLADRTAVHKLRTLKRKRSKLKKRLQWRQNLEKTIEELVAKRPHLTPAEEEELVRKCFQLETSMAKHGQQTIEQLKREMKKVGNQANKLGNKTHKKEVLTKAEEEKSIAKQRKKQKVS